MHGKMAELVLLAELGSVFQLCSGTWIESHQLQRSVVVKVRPAERLVRTKIVRASQLLIEQAIISGVFPRSPCRLQSVAL